MNDHQDNSISLQQRVERLETSLADLQHTVELLNSEIRQRTSQKAAIPAPPVEIYCPRCRGGNPVDGTRCIWCGQSLTAPAPGPAGAAMSRTRRVFVPQNTGDLSPRAVAANSEAMNSGQPSPSFHFDFDVLKRSEFWINKVGIGLLLLGLAFFFKYSLDQGWLGAILVPPVRVAFGLVLGSVLLVFGLRMHSSRRHYSQVLMGGSVASYYITGFASYELLHLAPYWLAFTFMVAVTLLAFALAIWQNESILSLIGTAGALATPFLLPTDSKDITGLISYTVLVLAGTSAIYLFRGWRSLLWTAFAGGWIVLSLAYEAFIRFRSDASLSDRWVFQVGVIWFLLAFWAVPVIREILWTKAASRWPYPTYPPTVPAGTDSFVGAHVYLSAVFASFLAAIYTNLAWDIPSEARGAIAITAATIYGQVALGLRKTHRNLSYLHVQMALVLLTVGFALLLHGPLLMLTLALEATVLHFIARRVADRGLALSGHIVSVVAALFLTAQLLATHPGEMPILNGAALAELAAIALGLVASFALTRPRQVLIYRLLTHVAFLGWLWRELSALDNGNGYVTITWGLYALALLITGIRLERNRFLMFIGIGTLFLVVAKLLLVDLVLVDTIWRILLFLGFGGVFLLLSFYLQNLMRPQREAEDLAPVKS